MPIENPYDFNDKVLEQEDPWALYLVIRESLGMSPGKIAAQCGHAVGIVYEYAYTKFPHLGGGNLDNLISLADAFQFWKNELYRKVVLYADDKEWEKLKTELNCFVVKDAGLTEIKSGEETCLAFWPIKKSQRPKL